MKVLVVGNGGREHALAWTLLRSPKVSQVFCIPGNGGTGGMDNCYNVALSLEDFEGVARLALTQGVAFVVIGPEAPLARGITDFLTHQGIKVFGPDQAGATIEASKSWAKALMTEAGVPTAASETFTDPDRAKAYVTTQGAPIVVKADGLAAGKGVIVAQTVEEAHQAIESLFQNQFSQLIVEEFLTGQEVSVLALTDGKVIRPLIPAQDHKQLREGDTGPNTGGMGAYAPTPIVDDALMATIEEKILQPTLAQLQKRDIDYRGVLYAGLMITPEGEPKVLEYNCRFGDPETQAVLPLLATPLEELLLACVEQRLDSLAPIEWQSGSAVCVVAASDGYPGNYEKGYAIAGIEQAEGLGAVVFHGGTKQHQQELLTDGGRVLGVTQVGESFDAAITQVYNAIDCIQFEGIYYRRDIGQRIKGLVNL